VSCQRTLNSQQAFTLVELALVLLVLGVLTRSLIGPLTGARNLMDRRTTTEQLDTIKQSLLGHVVATGVLPCPITPSSTTGFDFQVNDELSGACPDSIGGLPAGLLGLSGVIDGNGQLLDVWNRPFRYAISLDNHAHRGDIELPDWTSAGEASRVGLRELGASITVCSQKHENTCPRTHVRANSVVFVVLSMGKDDSSAGSQTENQDNDLEFLLQDESIDAATMYDDQLVWATAPDIMYWMLRSGWLP